MKHDGMAVAKTLEGHEMPVLDVTHPRFALVDSRENLRALTETLLRVERRNRRLPKFLMRFLLRSAAKKSRLARSIFGTDGAYLDGMSTYVLKLGAENLLPPYDTPMDRNFASSPHVTFMRLRTQQVAGLLADRLAVELKAEDDRPLHMINIAGGTAIDSLNALILAGKSPRLLDLSSFMCLTWRMQDRLSGQMR